MIPQSYGWSHAVLFDPLEYVDRRAAIAAAITASPLDEAGLRSGVWSYVGAEREAGQTPREVIVGLTALVDDAMPAPVSVKRALMRRVMLWCVEAYFGHLGEEVIAFTGDGSPASTCVDARR